jgi:hypothetical protein
MPALEILHCNQSSLRSINITNSVALQELQVYTNRLTNLDMTTNIALTELYVYENDLTSLDLSANPNITTLDVSFNALHTLNVQNGTNTNITSFNAQGNDNLFCVLVDDASYSTTNWTADTFTFSETDCNDVVVDVKVFLQGAFLNPNTGEETLMRDDLRANNFIDSDSPYGDGVSITEAVGNDNNGADSIVDWIWLELRDKSEPSIVIAGQSAVLQRDGDVVNTDENLITPVTFSDVPAGEYYIVVKHRNHLGIMTANTVTLTRGTTTINFTDATNEITDGSNAQTTFGMPTDIVAMWAGNVNGDTVVQYSGTSPDTPDILSVVLNDAGNFLNFPTYAISGYSDYDVDLDGTTQYSGTDPDVPFILQNVLAHPGNFLNFSTYQIMEQLPEDNGL